MSGDGFSRREITAVLTFTVLAVAIGTGSYITGLKIAGETAGGAEAVSVATGTPVNGQTLYATNCAGCHGPQAQGGVGPALTATKHWTAAAFAEAVLRGRAPDGRELAPVMPRFGETGLDGAPATDEQINAIHAYLRGL
ncbi:cytochrome c [Deinococcus sp. YIM 77859]|uniref:c-type cytochrome n=1 Tax=Deinococcus sp. YIM 77859 TaxID=1540221 RepID=UPI00055433C3|nr:cytochrome c [Deinococcus sp. YIM 77859]